MFLTMDSVFPNGATEADLLTIYRPRPGLPFSYCTLTCFQERLIRLEHMNCWLTNTCGCVPHEEKK